MGRSQGRIELVLPPSAAGKRLDAVLASLVPETSRTALQRWIRAGAVRLDGEAIRKPGFVLDLTPNRPGRIEIDVEGVEAVLETRAADAATAQGAATGTTLPTFPDLPVLFVDEHLIVVDKPAGLLTHGTQARRETSAADLVAAKFGPMPSMYGEDRPGIVHRLDRDTSGLLLFGRTLAALETLKSAFQAREIAKTYLAIVRGEPRFDTDWIEARLGRTSSHRDRISVVGEGEGRDASTYYEVRERFDGFALLAVFPKTGRTHQVRVHLTSLDLPLLGEALYLPRGARNPARKPGDPVMARHALHAQVLELAHPASGERLRFEAPLPADMAAALETLRLSRRGA